MSVLYMVIGFVMFIGGLFCAFTPLDTYAVLPTLIGFVMLVEGVGCFIAWLRFRQEKKDGTALLLINAILSVILGVSLLMDDMLQLTMDVMIPIFVASWMLLNGLFRIIDSFHIRRLGKDASQISGKDSATRFLRAMMRELGRTWWAHLILGILMVIVGGISFSSPFVTALTIGTWMGLEIAFTGLDLIFETRGAE